MSNLTMIADAREARLDYIAARVRRGARLLRERAEQRRAQLASLGVFS
jgi:hypothetical protein